MTEASRLYEKAISNEPEYVPAIVNAAICKQKNGDIDAALSLYDKASNVAPNDAQVLYNIGILLVEMRKFEIALVLLKRVIALNNRHVSAHNYLGLCYAALNQRDLAVKAYDAALTIDPNYQHAKANKAKLMNTQQKGFWGRIFGD